MAQGEPPASTPEKLAAYLTAAPELLLMLDYDGTLVPIAATPALARPAPELLATLQKLAFFPGRVVAVISGRKLDELQELLPLAGLYLVGSHGAEIKEPGGKVYRSMHNQQLKEDMVNLEIIARECMAKCSGFLVENKGTSLALHYRLADPGLAQKVLDSFIKRTSSIVRQKQLELLPGKKVLEIRPRGIHKGKAVAYLCRKYSRALPVYIGDDRTDEDAFMALKRGWGILVSPDSRPSAATVRLSSPGEVYKLLLQLCKEDYFKPARTT